MAPPYRRHVFICTNRRPPDAPRQSCAASGSEAIRDAFKKALAKRGLNQEIRANASGCLEACECGPSVVVYPEAVWYGPVSLDDVETIVEEHLVGGRPVERLRMDFSKIRKPAEKPAESKLPTVR
ncbi:(2Fe-2S) ferredoxin domain-containing protein [Vulgatibacter incomptus]|uniref:Ferredoxin n=1 Tax=Vulgatibacter incomptus TaxID=1391653 RepID=A0A0K1PC54_9BACT|nr:(2Fe-2S) ferredoxin domain-containing protein [Vulgatibacter incomptus]AKU90991.1 Ferredoxin [Vulgatibacter incomptus]